MSTIMSCDMWTCRFLLPDRREEDDALGAGVVGGGAEGWRGGARNRCHLGCPICPSAKEGEKV